MNLKPFVDDLAKRGIELWPDGDELTCEGPEETLTPDLIQILRTHKAALNHFLRTDAEFHPLAHAQQALWIEAQMAPENYTYHVSIAVRIHSPVDRDALRQAFQRLVNRHPALRTTFLTRDGQPVQQVFRHRPVDWTVIDAQDWQWEAIAPAVRIAHETPFDFVQGPLFRVRLFSHQPDNHVLLFTTHHLVCDGWSSWLLLQELRTCYPAARRDELPDLPPLQHTYTDYVKWQRELLENEGETLWAYWRDQLAGDLPILNLPTDHPRPAMRGYQGGSQWVAMPADLYEQLMQLAQREGVTLYVLLLAAFQVLLHRYSGQDDILVGSPFASRSRPEFAGICGDFASPVVLRANLAGNLSFTAFLQQVRQTLLDALTHQEYPFPLLVERLQPERDPSISPIFQALFTMQQSQGDTETLKLATSALNPTEEPIAWGELQLSSLDIPLFEGQFDLTLDILTTDDSLLGILRYNSDLFEPATIDRIASHYCTLLQSIVANPQQPIAELSLLSAAERHQLLDKWNDTAVAYPPAQYLHQLFEAQVERTPDGVALVVEGMQRSYAELNQLANQLAHHLCALGVAPETLVGICMERSLEMVVGLLAVLKAGGAYVPLDPTYPQERLAFMLDDAQVPILLTQTHLAEQLPTTAAQIICLDHDWETIASLPTQNPTTAVSSENLAYVIYTSGSTGQPKGAMNTHLGICNRLCWMQEQYQLTAADRVVQKTPFSFDVSVWEFFWPLSVGARLIILKPEGHKDPLYLGQMIQTHAITTIHFVPSMLQAFLNVVDVARCQSLRRVICSGEALSLALQEQFFAKLDAELHNLYGPTEAAIDVTYWQCQPEQMLSPVPIGRPVANTQIYLLDKQLQPVPIGVAGELHIGGPQVARGYHRRPELTAEKFIPNPYGDGKLYKTGDLARYLPDGVIEFLGRIDNQVKIRGFRVELGEIEATLVQHPSVAEVAVLAQAGQRGESQLVAYLVPTYHQSAGAEPVEALAPADLQKYLQTKLPDYMIPTAFVMLDALPLTPNGKLDRKALPTPDLVDRASEAKYVPPRTAMEETLSAIWRELLGLSQIGIQDNFFALGGHSLLATQVLARIRAALGVESTLQMLFAAPTIAELGRAIDDVQESNRSARLEPIVPVARTIPSPLSHAQERLWFLAQLEGGNAAYTIPCLLRITGELDPLVLERSLQEIVHRHEILRTTITLVDGQPMQKIGEPNLSLHRAELSSRTATDQDAELEQFVAADLQQPFDLTRGPLLRATLFCPSAQSLWPQSHFLLLHLHHIIADGWSLGVLLRELTAIYAAFRRGEAAPLPALKLQYADFAQWQRTWLSERVMDEQLAYWRKQLVDAPPLLTLPTDRPRPAVQTFNGATLVIPLPQNLSEQIAQLGVTSGTTLSMTLLAAFKVLLMRYSGQEEIVVGAPIANRNRVEVESLIGFFVNTLALRTDLSGQPTFRTLLERVQRVTLEAYRHQDIPFEKLVEALQPQRDRSHSPLFQVMYDFQQDLLTGVELPGLALDLVKFAYPIAKFDLTLSVQETSEGLLCFWEYNTDLFWPATIERMAGHFQTLLEEIVADPEQPIHQLSLLTTAEHQQIVGEWNAPRTITTIEKCVHQLFAEQVVRTPDSVAVAFHDEEAHSSIRLRTLTYHELNARSNQLAHYLLAQGIEPETVVGICVERSPEMIVALLGVLKAGSAYVPIDPTYPAERIRFILADTRASLVLTQAHLQPMLQEIHSRLFCLDTAWDEIAHLPRSTPSTNVTPDHLAYIIYTSGSTGTPKGVMVEHRSLTAFTRQTQADYAITAEDKLLQFAPVSFDASFQEIYPAFIAGATVVLRTEEMLRSPSVFLQSCADWGITVLAPPVAYWHLLVNALAQEDLRLPETIRLITIGGERVSAKHVRQWWEQVGDYPVLINEYGPTEATVTALRYTVTAQWVAGEEQPVEVPIGRPMATQQTYILDQQLNPTPIGVPGELCLGGVQVVRGYWNQPDLTAEKFIPNPFGEGRLYRTGDIARFLPDGNIEFVGRIDNQIKIRGFRVELGEIESALVNHPAVAEAAVIAHGEAEGDKQLVAYLVWQDELTDVSEGDSTSRHQHMTTDLVTYLRQQLPDYMIPARLIPVDAIPWTANDKLDRNALPQPEGIAWDGDAAYAPPRSATEAALAVIWCDVLQRERVGIHANFFEVGGHSLLATQVTSRIQRHFAIDIPLRTLFAAPTIAELAHAVETLYQSTQSEAYSAIIPVERGEALPLSHAQERLWFLDQLEGGSSQYNMISVLRLHGEVDADALASSLHALVERHENLRTIFQQVDGRPMQAITSPDVTLTSLDLAGLTEAEQDTEMQTVVAQEIHHRFDLSRGPLLRVTLLRPHPQSPQPHRHTLILNIHHIVFDGWSMEIFLRELAALYTAFHQRESSPLPALELQYADFAVWQRAWLQERVMIEQLDYWRTQLADAPPLLELPTDRPRPPIQTFNGAHYLTALPQPLSEQLQQFATRNDTTLFMTLLAAFKVLLMRYSRQADISVGSPIANRNRVELEALIGFFVNTLVLRSDLSGNPTFLELLQQIQETTLDAYHHQDIPFEKLVEELQPQRNLSHSPLVQVMFVLQNIPESTIVLPDLTVEEVPLGSVIAQFDLTLGIQEEDGQLHCLWEYNTDLFDTATIERMDGHWQILLQAIVDNPAQPIQQLPLLTAAESHQLLVTWNATKIDNQHSIHPELVEGKCIHHLFEEQAALYPDALALVSIAGTATPTDGVPVNPKSQIVYQWTYQQLNQRANQLAHYLQTLGVGPETLVGVYLDHSATLVVSLLGILKAGGAYVPLDPDYPQESLAFRLADAQIPVLLTQQSLLATLPHHQAQIILIDHDFGDFPSTNPASPVGVENLAYLIYTSGSTGDPNGVLIEHGGLYNSIVSDIRIFGIEAGSRLPHITSFNFDAATSHLFMGLCAGATIYMLPRNPDLLETTFPRLLQEAAITHAVLPVAMWSALPDLELPALKVMGAGADVCPPELVVRWGQGRRFFNVYGPTEATITATIAKCDPEEYKPSIGRPIANLQVYILDEQNQPVPIGVPGELHIGGIGLARGYLNRPQLTAKRFIHVNLPTATSHQLCRLYKTGDLARWLPDGSIEFMGRIDNQVKIRGFRVELGEIEAVLADYPDVWEAAVIPWAENSGGKRLAAYIVPDASVQVTRDIYSDELSPTMLRRFLQDKLPEHAIPAAFVVLDALPLTVNGKVDRQALPAPDTTTFGLDTTYAAPQTVTETLLAEIWQDVLRLAQLGIHDNFFEVGGDSILSIQIVARAKQSGLQITPKQLFQHQTIAELAAVATMAASTQSEQGIVTGDVPLTPIQHWFFQQDQPDLHHFNQSVMLEISPAVNVQWLETAIQALYQHHDALRLRFHQENTQWQQVNGGIGEEVSFCVIDLTVYREEERSEQLMQEAIRLQSSLDLMNGPLMHAALFRIGNNQPNRLLIVIHHLAIDGVSWRILLEDLEQAYQQLQENEPVQLPAKTTSFRAWSHWLREQGVPLVAHEVTYWRTQVATPAHSLPVDFAINTDEDGSVINSRVATSDEVQIALSAAETASLLKDVPAVYHTQINDLLLAALLQCICHWTGEDILLVDLEGHGRELLTGDEDAAADQTNIDLSRTVGWFTALYPVRLDLDQSHPGELIKSVKEQLRRIPNRGIGYGILRYLANDPTLMNQPQAEISFNYLGQMDGAFSDASPARDGNPTDIRQLILGNAVESSGPEQSFRHRRTHLLAIYCMITGGQLEMYWTYSQTLHRRETVETLVQEYMTALQQLIAHCLNPDAGGYTPSDFDATTLEQDELDDLLATLDI